MFHEEARWIRETLRDLHLASNIRVLDAGSSTLYARTRGQPFVDSEVHAPLRERGFRITHVDRKHDEGVDLVADLADPDADLAALAGHRFELVLCCSLLSVVESVPNVVASVSKALLPGGYMLATTLENFRYVTDPIENGWRPSPDELFEAFVRHGGVPLELLVSERLRVDDPREYHRALAPKKSSIQVGKRFLFVPGGVERIRLAVPAWRWRQSCVVMRRSGE